MSTFQHPWLIVYAEASLKAKRSMSTFHVDSWVQKTTIDDSSYRRTDDATKVVAYVLRNERWCPHVGMKSELMLYSAAAC